MSARSAVALAMAAFAFFSTAFAAPDVVTIGSTLELSTFGEQTLGTKKPKLTAVYFGPLVGAKGDPKLKLKITSFTPTTISAVVKKAKGSGSFDIQATPRGGEPFSIGSVFVVPPAPTDTDTGTVAPKGELTITGTAFGTKKPKVFVNGRKAKTTQWSDTSITVVLHKKTPAGDADVVVTNQVGSGTLPDAVTVAEPPSGGSSRANRLTATTSGDHRLRLRMLDDALFGRRNDTPVFTIEGDQTSRGEDITLSIAVRFDPSTHTGNRTEITLNAGNGESFDVELDTGTENRFYRLDPAGNGTSATVTITSYDATTGYLEADLSAELVDGDTGDRISFSGDVGVTLVLTQ